MEAELDREMAETVSVAVKLSTEDDANNNKRFQDYVMQLESQVSKLQDELDRYRDIAAIEMDVER